MPNVMTINLQNPASRDVIEPRASPQVSHPLRLIVADDSALTREIMQQLLEGLGFDLQMASNGIEAWKLLQAVDVPAIAILDWMMPGIEGIELCRRVRQLHRQHYTYVILLTSKSEKTDIIEGLRAGADDYVTKPFDAEEIQARLLVAQRIIRFQEELVAAREAMKVQAKHDYLTHLLNRAGIMEALDEEFSRSQRSGQPFSIMMADIDLFKRINDTYGHRVGDDVLCEVATRINTSIRPYDSVGRYGGEEFLIIAPGLDQSAALQAGERVRESFCQRPIQRQGQTLQVTISLGVTTWAAGTSPEALLAAADAALYEAKQSGRNCTRLISLNTCLPSR